MSSFYKKLESVQPVWYILKTADGAIMKTNVKIFRFKNSCQKMPIMKSNK